MDILRRILIVILGLNFFVAIAQEGKIKKVEKDYRDFSYVKTSEVLLEVANGGYKSVNLFQKLGNAYYFNNDMANAAKWYGELMAMDATIDPEYYYRYAQALKFIENYEEADKWMQLFYEKNPSDSRGRAFMSKVDYLSKIEEVSREDIVLKNLDINSELSDFGGVQYTDKLIFASTRGEGELYEWNEQPFLDLYAATKESNGNYSNPTALNSMVNTKYHESSASFTPDDVFMFFTRNNFYKRKYKKDKEGTNRLKLFRAKMQKDGTWNEIVPVHFNSNDYSVAHPSINVYGKKLYFASDMPGTIGNSDIYVVNIFEDGSLGEPINLGKMVNTEGHETFPYINSKGDLFFSSNGYPGLGGLDVYVVRDFENKFERHEKLIVENIGKPINSPQDDFAYYENLGTKEGFISSNRPGGKGDDDIYSFVIPEEKPCMQLVEGVVKDKNTLEILPLSTVVLFDHEGNELQQIQVDENAVFSFELPCDKEFLVRGSKEKYTPDEKRFTTPIKPQELKLELLLDAEVIPLRPCDDLAKILDIPIIHFDFDKYNIRYDAEVELQKVLAVMNQYPTMIVDIRSHTDCRGTFKYNERLSDNRAKSTRQYLIDKGIAPERLTAKGYGEYRLINNCECEFGMEVECSEAEHQENRRSEFIVVSINGETCVD